MQHEPAFIIAVDTLDPQFLFWKVAFVDLYVVNNESSRLVFKVPAKPKEYDSLSQSSIKL